MTESMAQSLYDIAGTAFRYDSEADSVEDFLTVVQGNSISVDGISSMTLEGLGKRLRHGISAFFHVTARMTISGAGTGGEHIVLDVAPMLSNDVGSTGGIPCGTGCTFPASAVVGGAAIPSAQWRATGNAASTFELVDKDGVAVTTALQASDRLGLCISAVSIDD